MAEQKYEAKHNSDIKQIISIDLGSFGSTAAHCLPSSPQKYSVIQLWPGMNDDDCIKTMNAGLKKKTLTAILWDINEKKVEAFGWRAHQKYHHYIGLKKDIDRLKKN